jgi:hypothetical protein
LRLPALEEVDAAGVDQISGDGEVEAASCPACPFDDTHAAREVGLALLGFDRECPATMTMDALLFWCLGVKPARSCARARAAPLIP